MTRWCSPGTLALTLVVSLGVALSVPPPVSAQMPPADGQGMPDARMMSGIPMPMSDLPSGAVSVRLVRGELSNGVANHPVELVADGTSQTAKTDESGRAQFTGIAVGTSVKAVATIDGEVVESQPFAIPAQGGVRILLAAADPAAAAAAGAPPVAGTVTFASDSRIAIEFDDATLSVFYLLEVRNGGSAPVNPATPITFELPAEATGASLLEGSSKQAEVKGRQVTINGPFKPGRTSVQLAYLLDPAGPARTIVQPFPVAFDGVTIVVQKVGGLHVRSPQADQQREMPGEGRTYILGTGPALAAGRPISIDLAGLPHHDTWPRNVALALGVLILGAGLWTALGGPRSGQDARRKTLEARRDLLFADLLAIEDARRAGSADDVVSDDRRTALLGELERVYGELDRGAALGEKETAR